MVYLVIYNSSFPEDHEIISNIKAVYDEKLEAFNKAIELTNETKCSYVYYQIKEVEEDILLKDIKDTNINDFYTCHHNFILNGRKVIFHKNNASLIDKNNELITRKKNIDNLIEELNKKYVEIYNKEMILYREKKIRHPIQKKLETITFFDFPYEEDKLKNVENLLESMEIELNKRKNDISSMF